MTARGEALFITGGGTAGHVLPALAIADALVASGVERSALRFVGSRRGMEAQLVPPRGIALTLLPGRGVVRRPTPASAAALAGLGVALARALVLVAWHRPRAVVSLGGYAALACSLAAAALRRPLVVVNVDAVPGAVNRVTGRFARVCAVAFTGTPLPRAVVTGAPVRPEVLGVDRSPEGRACARRRLGVGDGALVAVVGGSLGARRLNDAALDLARRLAGRSDLLLYHVAGARNLEEVGRRRAALGSPSGSVAYRLVGFEERMPELLAAADLVVCRAGASTVAELAVVGTPSILVPLPGAPGDHQRRNADALARAGGAIVLDDAACTGERLAGLVEELLEDPARLAEMSRAARTLGRPDAAAAIARLVAEVAAAPPSGRVPGGRGARHGEERSPGAGARSARR
ncbi:MAG TPA: UDP-N-acetylglucosamine--N-acetylmuramyl-(pentapeptide) pyrophosphoryl-undecaprenol N-acetylglucosamine transferase [Acidimicrobiales bacterium]|nr:UDP-N-acetylglucosamine--N-acetylmuramyl-(pentapeptide) pyrophosphoryl-undecaprenol N-acetylglucosamine transferase [Acidimicrobiales bacterium]